MKCSHQAMSVAYHRWDVRWKEEGSHAPKVQTDDGAASVELRSVQNLRFSQLIHYILVESGSSVFSKINGFHIMSYEQFILYIAPGKSRPTPELDCCLGLQMCHVTGETLASPCIYPRFGLDTWLWVKIKDPKKRPQIVGIILHSTSTSQGTQV